MTTSEPHSTVRELNPRFLVGPPELFEKEYMAEITALSRITARPNFPELLEALSSYDEFLESVQHNAATRTQIATAGCRGQGIIDPTTTSDRVISEAFSISHLGACCLLLHGSELTLEQLRPPELLNLARQFAKSTAKRPEIARRAIIEKFHAMDTIRAVQFARTLGLLPLKTHAVHQLGIGSGEGSRDVLFTHMKPGITRISAHGKAGYRLTIRQEENADTILIDADPNLKEHYARLNNNEALSVSAHNGDTIEVLRELGRSPPRKRNLVTGFRIDHRMIPDVDEFLRALAPCLSEQACLIMTIGAGDSARDFEGRITVFRELCRRLQDTGHYPMLFSLHGKGNPGKQRQTLKIGNLRASSYELLYCTLDRQKLTDLGP